MGSRRQGPESRQRTQVPPKVIHRAGVGPLQGFENGLDQRLTRPGISAGERLRGLLPELAELPVERFRLPALRSLNFVVHGLLEEGVAASTRQDPQAKSLGEWLRARIVDVPEVLLS